MQIKAENPIEFLAGQDAPAIIQAYFEFNHLKHIYRQGWLQRGLSPEVVESVAEHILGVAMLAWWLAEAHFPDLDANRVMRLALVHDLGEIYAGDLTPNDRTSAEEKSRLEAAAIAQIFNKLPGGERYRTLWEEYETGASPEAQFVKRVDRLEMALQASIYEYQAERPLQEFFNSAEETLKNSELAPVLAKVQALRRAFPGK